MSIEVANIPPFSPNGAAPRCGTGSEPERSNDTRPWYVEVDERVVASLGLEHSIWPGGSPELPAPRATANPLFEPGGERVDVTLLRAADASGDCWPRPPT